VEMSIMEAVELLTNFVDESDPDLDLPQVVHALQTAEAIRKTYPSEEFDWFHLVGFIHDLGKVLAHPLFGSQPQWAVVGDTFPLGCKFSEKIVYSEFFQQNPDYNNPSYNTELGIYEPQCGLNNLLMSWGHDEYFYQVCLANNCKIPKQGLAMIRFHSFYPWHTYGGYQSLTSEEDEENRNWVLEFNKCDLYSKSPDIAYRASELLPYYQKLIEKYFPAKLRW